MSSQVLARKWRPRTFREMVGQEHVLTALINALDHNRLHHAFLFTGTRGVGKTSVARIFAACLNCEVGVSSEPCGTCSSCTEIREGRFVDLIEVDAASKTKVDDTRELLDNVQYAPTRGRYKVYLIDEVHMLSTHSFNALLKTLEEPPPHVKFLLATTDPQKLPVTILSRCLQFNLKNLSPERISGQLNHVLSNEMIQTESEAIYALARAAEGSMRDALSLADQAIAFGGGSVTADGVAAMLGSLNRNAVNNLLAAVCSGDNQAMLAQVAELSEHSPDYDLLLTEMLSLIHRLVVEQTVPGSLPEQISGRDTLIGLAASTSPEDLQLFYQIGVTGRSELEQVPDARMGLEMLLLRMMAFRPFKSENTAKKPEAVKSAATEQIVQQPVQPHSSNQQTPVSAGRPAGGAASLFSSAEPKPAEVKPVDVKPVESTPSVSVQPIVENEPIEPIEPIEAIDPIEPIEPIEPIDPEVAQSEPGPEPETPQPVLANAPANQHAPTPIEVENSPLGRPWHEIVDGLELKGMIANVAANTQLVSNADGLLKLVLDQERSALFSVAHQQRLAEELSKYLDQSFRVEIELGAPTVETPAKRSERLAAARLAEAVTSLKNHPQMAVINELFGGTLIEESVKPIDV